ncbi:hypothetical protein HY524_01720 [Candidatus Berkelbacteria bacterium]|nr:hypothetical protein [Candidatus Berkelbacteria bacterium]
MREVGELFGEDFADAEHQQEPLRELAVTVPVVASWHFVTVQESDGTWTSRPDGWILLPFKGATPEGAETGARNQFAEFLRYHVDEWPPEPPQYYDLTDEEVATILEYRDRILEE